MRFLATDVYDYYKPSPCARRVALEAAGVPPQETDTPFLELLQRLGREHELRHRGKLTGVVDLSAHDPAAREVRTLEAIRGAAPAIYQPRFRAAVDLDGDPCELVGEPDFLLRDPASGSYAIRDSKLARNVLSSRHAGIPLQLQVYGFLYERATGEPPARLEVHNGADDVVAIPYEGAAGVLALLREHRAMRAADPEAYEPVGWTKCAGCGYEERCWRRARIARDVSVLTRVSQDRARELHRLGIATVAAIPSAVNDLSPAHRDYFWTGTRKPRPKDFVAPLLACARSYLEDRPIWLDDASAPALPAGPSFAMLDLEGLPPRLDELDRVYLWGMKVFGERPSGYLAAQAGFGAEGDREGWFAFLELVGRLLAEHGPDLPFVHWSAYETGKIEAYVERYGDVPLSSAHHPRQIRRHPDPERSEGEGSPTRAAEDAVGIARLILRNSIDLLRLLKEKVVLPLPSYSLKVVDAYVGFRRRLPDANGAWSMAKYVEATETSDADARAAILGEILSYNEEDLDATWAVFEWVRARAPIPPASE